MNDFIQRIGPVERDIDPIYRVEKAKDHDEKPPEQRKKRHSPEKEMQSQTPEDVGPVEGDDGHLHIDVQA
jgi:hypothetical protein